MIENEWRRKLAAKLRKNALWWERMHPEGDLYDGDNCKRITALLWGNCTAYHSEQMHVYLAYLAELIDRPTCRLSYTNSEFDTIVSCSRCGRTFLEPPCVLNYCPICGAEVVE